MRRILPLIFWQFGLLAGGRLFADVVTLKDGHQISGLVESGNIQELRIKVGDQSQTIDIHQVQAIQFGVSLPTPEASPARPKAAALSPEPAPAAAAPTLKAGALPPTASPPPTSGPTGTITPGTGAEIPVGAADSTGRKASLDDPITSGGVEVAPANAFHRGKVETCDVDSRGGSQAQRALPGAVAGGGATFAGTPAGKLTGMGVEIAPETRFTNRLTQPAFIDSERGRQ
jgi:hypothetical protein